MINYKEKFEKLQTVILKDAARNIKFIEEPSEEQMITAVRDYHSNIEYIKNPTEKVQLMALRNAHNRYSAFNRIKNPTKATKIFAVKQTGGCIELIKNPTEDLQFIAVKQNHEHIQYIKRPTKAVKAYVEDVISKLPPPPKEYTFEDPKATDKTWRKILEKQRVKTIKGIRAELSDPDMQDFFNLDNVKDMEIYKLLGKVVKKRAGCLGHNEQDTYDVVHMEKEAIQGMDKILAKAKNVKQALNMADKMCDTHFIEEPVCVLIHGKY